jgi:hypothetical protein
MNSLRFHLLVLFLFVAECHLMLHYTGPGGSTGWTAAFLAFGSGSQGKTILIDLILPDVSTIFKKLIPLYNI